MRFFVNVARQVSGPTAAWARVQARKHLQDVRGAVERLNLADLRWRIRFYEGLLAEIGGDTAQR